MDSTVPAGAAILLEFVYRTETGRTPPACYDTVFGHNEGRLDKPVTRMTLGEVQASQRNWSRRFGSSATGAYQFVRATLKGLIGELGLEGTQRLDPDLQDRLAYHLLIRRGYHQFMAGEIGAEEFARRLAMEWASFPVLGATRGARRQLKRGQSYYAGDRLNRALVAPEQIERVLARAKEAGAVSGVPQPVRKTVENAANRIEKPALRSRTNWLAGIGALLGSAGTLLANLHPVVQGMMVAAIVAGAVVIWRERQKKTGLARTLRQVVVPR
jgi:muramidase (phage lysozyme)